jgi:mono/diheme cytochrome c family protein
MQKSLIIFVLAATFARESFGADLKAGQAAYDKACKSCHGPDGAANASIAKAMKVEMRDLKSAEVQSRGDADLKKAITDGVGKMRPVNTISGTAQDDVVAYVRSLKK